MFDDTAIAEYVRARLMGQIRRHMGGVDLLYIAARHNTADEKRVRAAGAQYYTGKPINRPQFTAILKSFMRARARRDPPAASAIRRQEATEMDEKDRLGDKLRDVEKAREDQWAHERDRELIEKLRKKGKDETAEAAKNKNPTK
ncbi:MAG: hypothetical protein ACREQN_01290 [Candidatus Binataceae bacterium]